MNRVFYKNILKSKVLERIDQISGNIILREDTRYGKRPSNKSLFQRTCRNGSVSLNCSGIYAKAYISEFINKLVIKGGFGSVCKVNILQAQLILSFLEN